MTNLRHGRRSEAGSRNRGALCPVADRRDQTVTSAWPNRVHRSLRVNSAREWAGSRLRRGCVRIALRGILTRSGKVLHGWLDAGTVAFGFGGAPGVSVRGRTRGSPGDRRQVAVADRVQSGTVTWRERAGEEV